MFYVETLADEEEEERQPPLPKGYKQVTVTIQIIVQDEQFDSLQDKLWPVPDKTLAEAIAQALQLSGKFRVHPHNFDFRQPCESSISQDDVNNYVNAIASAGGLPSRLFSR